MAERLQVSRSWLSRYLELARLPPEVVAAYGNSHALGISHAARLAPALKTVALRDRMAVRSGEVVAEQQARAGRAEALLPPAEVTRRLLDVGRPARKPAQRAEAKDSAGHVIARAERSRGGAITIVIPKPDALDGSDLLIGVMAMLEKLSP